MSSQIKLNSIEEAIADIRAGKVIIVVDDEDRENEGDFICAAEMVTPDVINFMSMHGRGLICTPIEEKRADELGLDLMVGANTALHETAFTVSIDLIGHGCTTGISAYDRATGIRHLTNSEAKASDFARPGHIFPLRAKTGGVLRRTGHTEAAVDLAQLAGLYPAGVLVEILNPDGSMARLPQLLEVARKFDLKIVSIDDLVAYRMRTERLIKREMETRMKTVYGEFDAIVFTDVSSGDTHLVLKKGEWTGDEAVMVRVHSWSETGGILGNLLADYGLQIKSALETIAENGKGAFVYLRQADKADLLARLKIYKQLADDGEPEKFELHTSMGKKDFGVGAQILREMGISKIRLLTNHPRPRTGFIGYGLEIVENIQL
ncbi:MAG: 3,4-dihydroxy-2-butanone-4-phosphate synthase [Saprospiraceae bacterium]|nr:3,4-dihydroxy-2-butanone-4-phosphate synthase [Saprospiraceae bacterium]MCB0543980.1 3,4-dihydroxy-2-butanone-4-phosphate synthase [Saprospiraceae bacterium]MCB0573885.1 3,4-dihydroxy-2-butanone-4-phosphate synthase [Saprospiraceae bacterium]MCB9308010.1 3,4-dihydroxy-2-butanone-4-phosphate synthase [Lewinellaceae bacterium]MCB9354485.1 3,4-dihydroxy-2-butanone-4-phosphate synthase [Lewinellaceae bacterium]